MITSKIKEHPSHITFEGFGLKEQSQVKCEKILTLEKVHLIKKVGNIDDINIQINIEKALSQQLQLDSRYNNFDALDLENLFIDNNNMVENDKIKLEKFKSELFSSFRNKEYKESIIIAYKLKELSISSKYQFKK